MIEQVIDASVAIKWVVKGEPFRNKTRQLLYDAHLNSITLIGPPLLEYEVESVLQRGLKDNWVNTSQTEVTISHRYRKLGQRSRTRNRAIQQEQHKVSRRCALD